MALVASTISAAIARRARTRRWTRGRWIPVGTGRRSDRERFARGGPRMFTIAPTELPGRRSDPGRDAGGGWASERSHAAVYQDDHAQCACSAVAPSGSRRAGGVRVRVRCRCPLYKSDSSVVVEKLRLSRLPQARQPVGRGSAMTDVVDVRIGNLGLHGSKAGVVVGELVEVRPRDLPGRDLVVVGDVRCGVADAVLELDLEALLEVCDVKPGDRPVDRRSSWHDRALRVVL